MPQAKRLPILLWGDLVEDGAPVLRRALAGYRAHECMYAWVYLTDYLAHRRLLDALAGMAPESRRNLLDELDGDLWKRLNRAAIDPHFQLSKAGFEAVAHMACIAAAADERKPVFVELGSTFFASKTKLEILNRAADWPPLEPAWIGVDNSAFMHDATRALHGGSAVRMVNDYHQVAEPERLALFLSRFVASYAFSGGQPFADYLAGRFQAALIEDAYSTSGEDVRVSNHGQPEVFFSIPETFGRIEQAGFAIHVLDSYPDFPAGSAPCHVIRYLAAKKGVLNDRANGSLAQLGFARLGAPATAGMLLEQLNARITAKQWRIVERAKRESPVWGRTAYDAGRKSLFASFRNLLGKGRAYAGWRRYRLGGPLARREIERALDEEKP